MKRARFTVRVLAPVLAVPIILLLLFGCHETKEVTFIPPGNPPQVTTINAGLKPETQGNGDLAKMGITVYHAQLKENGTRAPIEEWTGGTVLQMAAEYYAVITGDYDVTLADVLQAGLWPYKTIPTNAMLDDHIYGGDTHASFLEPDPKDKVALQIVARHDILVQFFANVYRSANMLPIQPPSQFPRDQRFWINPKTNAPMTESPSRGDYVQVKIGDLPHDAWFSTAMWVGEDWVFPVINLFDRNSSTTESSAKSSSTTYCCYLFLNQQTYHSEDQVWFPVTCTCTNAPPQKCQICLQYNCTWHVNLQTLVRAPCDDPPSGGVLVGCPATANDYVDATGCGNPVVSTTCRECAGTSTGTCDDVQNLVNDLNGLHPPGVYNVPGSEHESHCDC